MALRILGHCAYLMDQSECDICAVSITFKMAIESKEMCGFLLESVEDLGNDRNNLFTNQ